MKTDQEAFEEWAIANWPFAADEDAASIWHAALAWMRSQGEPVAEVVDEIGVGRRVIFNSYKALYETPLHTKLYAAPQPAIPDGWLERGKAALAECRAADDLWSDDKLLLHLFNAMTATTQPVATVGWQPIETSPEGAEGYAWMLLAWGPEDDMSVGTGMRWGNRFFAVGVFYCMGREKQYEMRETEVQPRYWMPLPAAPEPSK